MLTKKEKLTKLMEITRLFIDSGVCPKSPRTFSHWWKIVRFAHNKGYLYVGFDKGKIDLAVVGYRVESTNPSDTMPEKESGHILYVPILASKSKDKTKIIKILRYYLKDNKDVNRIVYNWRGDDHDLRIKSLRKRRNYYERI